MTATETAIAGLWRITSKAVSDERGVVREFFRTSSYDTAALGQPERWAQINMTWTRAGAVRGLHGEATAKLVGVASGAAFGAYLDVRKDSSSYGTVVTERLEVGVQMLVPPGVCNGFQALDPDGCEYVYCFGLEWHPDLPGVSVRPHDPALAITWPLPIDVDDPSSISAKDASAPLFSQL